MTLVGRATLTLSCCKTERGRRQRGVIHKRQPHTDGPVSNLQGVCCNLCSWTHRISGIQSHDPNICTSALTVLVGGRQVSHEVLRVTVYLLNGQCCGQLPCCVLRSTHLRQCKV